MYLHSFLKKGYEKQKSRSILYLMNTMNPLVSLKISASFTFETLYIYFTKSMENKYVIFQKITTTNVEKNLIEVTN